MQWTGERVIPWRNINPRVMHCHIMRYAWATQFVAGKTVCDVGSGAGYGSFMLSWVAKSVVGVDISGEAIEFASEHFYVRNLSFRPADVEKDALPRADVYVCFEVLEHLKDPHALIQRYRPLVWSIPVNNRNEYHKHVYSADQILALAPGARGYQTGQGVIRQEIPEEPVRGYILGYAE